MDSFSVDVRNWLVVTALILFLASAVRAQTMPNQAVADSGQQSASTAPLTLTLQDALERARKNNPEYRAAVTESGLAKEDKVQSRAALLPSVSYLNSFIYTEGNGTELPGQTEIRRENLQRDVAVTARLEGTNLGSGMAAVQKAVAGLHLPASIRVVYGGTYEEQQKSFRDLVFVLILAILLVFITLLFEFRTFAAPVAILASALLSTSGVFIALLITRTTFNVSSFMGMIMVIGIVAKNGILLLDADHKFRVLGFSRQDAMLQASRRRLRPIVMTALATVAGMLPLAFAIGAGSQMLQPLAIAVIGGILISMVLSLVITPAVHYYLSHEISVVEEPLPASP